MCNSLSSNHRPSLWVAQRWAIGEKEAGKPRISYSVHVKSKSRETIFCHFFKALTGPSLFIQNAFNLPRSVLGFFPCLLIYIPLPFAFFSFLRTHHLRNYFCLVGPSIQKDPKWESIVVQYSKCEGWMMASFLPLSKSNSVRIIPFFYSFLAGVSLPNTS